MGRLLILWNILISLLWPLLYFYKPFRGTLRQRLGNFALGRYDPHHAGLKVLINAVSAGEVNAIAPFIRELKKLRPDAQVALLTTTDSGLEMARSKLASDVELVTFFPLIDLPFATRRFLDKLRPDLYITTEAELWPNIQALSKVRGVKTALVNGRVYMHNKAGWRGSLIRKLLGMLDLIVCQDERQRANFLKLGIANEKLTVSGNIKFDFELPEWSNEQLSEWRKRLGIEPDDQVIVAGSTHEGEEEIILRFGYFGSPRLVIAPRHVERSSEVTTISKADHFITTTLSQWEKGNNDRWDVMVVDRYGVLTDFYRIADVVVMGGTFNSKVGGHNILEATSLGKPVIVGPVTFGISAQVEMLDTAGGIIHTSDTVNPLDPSASTPDGFGIVLSQLLNDLSRAAAVGQAAKEVSDTNRGAAKRAAEQVMSLLAAPTMQP